MEKMSLVEGDVLQLRSDHERFPGMLVVCTEPKSWGCQGYLMSSRDFHAVKYNGRAFVRTKFEDMEYVGRLTWIEEDKENESA